MMMFEKVEIEEILWRTLLIIVLVEWQKQYAKEP